MAKKILFVDDDYNILNLLVNFLTMKGFEVDTAENGYFALKKIEEFKPDVILLDIMMPRLDGYEVCMKIRSLPDYNLARVPIIVMSALNHLNDVKKAISIGANDYIVKPINLQVLVEKINRYVKVESVIKKETIDDSLFTVERLGKGLVVSVQGNIDEAVFKIFKKNTASYPEHDFLILFFQNIKHVGLIHTEMIESFITTFAGSSSVKLKGLAVEQKDLFILMEKSAIRNRLQVFSTLMEAYEGMKK